MKASQFFISTQKEAPAEAEIISHQLMMRAGLIKRIGSGIYTYMPMGLRSVRKVEAIVREEMNKAGAMELLMPAVQPAELWQESGRWEQYGPELLRFKDRHARDFVVGPTHEEVITDVVRRDFKSYKQLPANFYQIQTKFRDEIRPRFGVMRGREFLMKDSYSFAANMDDALKVYDTMYATYFKIFRRLGLTAVPFAADTGMIGGNVSHEFQVMAETGESEIFYDEAFDAAVAQPELDLDYLKSLYSAADEKHVPAECPIPLERVKTARGIEVGHIFLLGDKYSKAMGAKVQLPDGSDIPAIMGCYGIGVSRLVGALIEANHDENGIIWPESVAPFHVGLINLRQGDAACDAKCEEIYATLKNNGISVLYHDTDERAGGKFATMDLIGLPWQIAIGPRGLEACTVELKHRKTGEKSEVSLEAAIAKISK